MFGGADISKPLQNAEIKMKISLHKLIYKMTAMISIFLMIFVNSGLAIAEVTTEAPTPTPTPAAVNTESTLQEDAVTITPTPSPTLASAPEISNTQTEPKKECGTNAATGTIGDIGNKEVVKVDQNNQNSTDTNVSAGIISGKNDVDYNSGNGTVGAGNVQGSLDLINSDDSNIEGPVQTGVLVTKDLTGTLSIGDFLAYLDANSKNSTTGQNSENTALVDLINTVIFNDNSSNNINNNLPINIDTGNNSANYNTGNGSVVSGNVDLAANILNLINSSFVGKVTVGMLNIFGNYLGDILLPKSNDPNNSGGIVAVSAGNSNTGSNSDNTAVADNTYKYIFVSNLTNSIQNTLPVNVSTGNNSADYNTGNGSVQSGSIDVKSNTTSIVGAIFDGNKWYLLLINVLGDWFGGSNAENSQNVVSGSGGGNSNIVASNDTTGQNSDNDASSSNQNNIEVTDNSKNTIENNMPININTGNNNASYNTGNGNVKSGDVSLILNFVNFINSKIKASNIGILFVNIFGNWKGSVKYEDKKVVKVDTTQESSQKITVEKTVSGSSVVDESKSDLSVKNDSSASSENMAITEKSEVKSDNNSSDVASFNSSGGDKNGNNDSRLALARLSLSSALALIIILAVAYQIILNKRLIKGGKR